MDGAPRNWRTAWVTSFADLSATERCVLYYLADMADDAGQVITKRQTIADSLGAGEQVVKRALAVLTSRGIVTRGATSKLGATLSLIGKSNSGIWPPITSAWAATGEHPNSRNGCSSGAYPPQPTLNQQNGIRVMREPETVMRITGEPELAPIPGYGRTGMASRVEYSFLLPSSSLTSLVHPPSPQIAAPANPAPPQAKAAASQPKRVATGQSDLLGAPVTVEEHQLMQAAVATWTEWQKTIGRSGRIKITESRTRRFMAAWNELLDRNMTKWRWVCRRCTRNALLAGKAGNWGGADFDWVLRQDKLVMILEDRRYPENYDAAEQPGAA